MTFDALTSGLPSNFAPLRPHLETASTAAQDVKLERAGHLWSHLGSHLRDIADYQGARRALERALKIDEAAFGPDHPEVAIRVNNLGSVLKDLGDLEAARQHYERALTIFKASLPADHPHIQVVRRHLEALDRQLAQNE